MGLPMKPRVYVVEGRCIRISILGLSLFSSILEISTRNAWGFEFPPIHLPLNRREYFKTSATLVTTTLGLPHSTVAAEEFVNEPDTSQGFQAYSIIPDASAALSPGLVPLEVSIMCILSLLALDGFMFLTWFRQQFRSTQLFTTYHFLSQ